jgi:hypothetical protein
MTDVYAVGVTITLVDKVSGALGAIARKFATTETAAAALNAKLATIGASFNRGLMFGAAGAALAAPLVHATKVAEKYQHTLNQLNTAGMSQAEIAASVASAWKTAGSVITSTATENLKIISDLRTVLGDNNEAIAYAPRFAKVQGAYASILDHKLAGQAENQSFAAMKAIDKLGAVHNSAEVNKHLEAMFRVTESTLGRVLPSDYQNFNKFARQASYGLDDQFRYKVLPELLMENKGAGGGSAGGTGPQVAALYRFNVQGIMNKRSAEMASQMGMIPAGSVLKTTTSGTTLKGGLLGADLSAKNPLRWVQEVLMPRIEKLYHIDASDTGAIIEKTNQLYKSNQGAAALVAEFVKKSQQYERFGKLYDETPGIDAAYDMGMKNDPAANWKALHSAFENLNTAIGEQILPVLIPRINQLATGIQRVAGFLHNNPGFTKLATGLVATASGALLAAGAVNILNAGFMGLKLMAGPLGMLLGRMTPLGIAVTAVAVAAGLLLANSKPLQDWMHQHANFLTHIAASVVVVVQKLGLVIKNMGNQIADTVERISVLYGLDSLTKKWVADARSALDSATTVTAAQAIADRKTLARAGLGGVVDFAKGTAPGQKNTVNQTNNMTFNVTGAKDQDAEKLAQRLMKTLNDGLRQAGSAASRAGGVAKSAYSVGGGR